MGFHLEDYNDSAGGSELSSKPMKPMAQSSEATVACALCSKQFQRSKSKSFPFCSPRCRQIDLGNWLNEAYGFPVEDGQIYDADDDE